MQSIADLESLPTPELFERALAEDPEAEDHPAMHALRLRGTLEVFEYAKQLCADCHAQERELAVQIIAQLGLAKPETERPWHAEAVYLMIRMLEDVDPRVQVAAAYGLGHVNAEPATTVLMSLATHPNARIRQAVAAGLWGHNDPAVTPVLIGLSRDEADEVRNWATAGLNMRAVDSPGVRDALRARVTDPFEDARAEAIWGLARRHDPEGLRLLIERLDADEYWHGDEMAACEVLGIRESTADVEQLIAGLRALLSQRPS